METVILKIAIGSTVFLSLYYMLLRNERTLQFNRFYLLGTLVLSYIMPFVTLPTAAAKPAAGLFVGIPVLVEVAGTAKATSGFELAFWLLISYSAVSAVLLLRFLFHLYHIACLKGKSARYNGTRIITGDFPQAPFSFLQTIYFNKDQFVNGRPDERMFLHENCHVQQKHTLDVLLVELLIVISWWNPALYLYRNAVLLNHEYLADAAVLQQTPDRSGYADLILNSLTVKNTLKFTHQFNFIHIKKRFTMMNTNNSRFAGLKRWTLLPAIAATALLFAKVKETKSNPVLEKIMPATPEVQTSTFQENAANREKEILVNPAAAQQVIVEDTIRRNARQEPTPPPPPPPPHEFKGILPQFPNGINAYRTLLASRFDTSALLGTTGTVRATIYFNINEDGKISDIRVEGNNEVFNREAERAVATTKDILWTPATENGEAVIYRFMMPLTMTFE